MSNPYAKYDKEYINNLFEESKTWKDFAEKLNVSLTSARQQYLVCNNKCTVCKNELNKFGYKCTHCLGIQSDYYHKNYSKNNKTSKNCKHCNSLFYREQSDTHVSWGLKSTCSNCKIQYRRLKDRKYYNEVLKFDKERIWLNGQMRRKRTKLGSRVYLATKIKELKEKTKICGYCKDELNPSNSHIDHILPISRGGSHNIENLQIICKCCNLMKSSKTHEEFLLYFEKKYM